MRRTYFLILPVLLLPGVVIAQQPQRLLQTHSVQRLPATATLVQPASMDTAHVSMAPDPVVVSSETPVSSVALASGQAPEIQVGAAAGLTLADLEAMALKCNPAIAQAASLVQAARGNHLQVGLAPNPTVAYEGQQIGSRGLAEQDGIAISQEIVRGGKLKLNRQIAAQEWARAEQELEIQKKRVLTDVRVAYYHVVIAQRQADLTAELRKVAREALGSAEELFRGKEAGRVDVVQAELEAENAEILSQNAQNRQRAAWQTLATVVGHPQLGMEPLAGNADDLHDAFSWDESLHQLLVCSPEIAKAAAELERARWAVQRAMVEKKPNVTVQGLVNWRDNGIGGRSDGAISVGVPLPVWNRNQGGVSQAQHEAAAAQHALNKLELSLQNRLAPVYERYANALNQVNKYRAKILPAAQESLDLNRKLYKAGETSFLNLLTAQRTYTQTNLNYLESLRELRVNEAEITGLLLSNSLETR
jgi:outer membrane protein, heavy metal efflux system